MADKDKAATPAATPTEKTLETIRCIVRWHAEEPENATHEISVNPVCDGPSQKKKFLPNVPVDLTRAQINALRNAVIEHKVAVDEASGIYKAENPLAAAEAQFPGFRAVQDPTTGQIYLMSNTPRFTIERADDVLQTA